MTEHVTAVITLANDELAMLSADEADLGEKLAPGGKHLADLHARLVSHSIAIDVVSPSCARVLTESIERIRERRKVAEDQNTNFMYGVLYDELSALRVALPAAHQRALAHPRADEKEVKQTAEVLNFPITIDRVARLNPRRYIDEE
ncbi:hypothetical protein [Tsukamurella spumae]|uniref:Uncharacterized protein n=1 Tax=Tsukamurella spumae TaxID=44753 RepID=A0A846X7J5_9ACTN|nr:hypothetical protein [Tsukamurella spumae]NKY19730.1 hypothetical protein [Tsukamurella spumae]